MLWGAAFDNLRKQLHSIHEAVVPVRSAVEDRPEDHQLESELDHALLELSSELQDARSAMQALRPGTELTDLEAGVQALTDCHVHCLALCERLLALGAYERLAEVSRFGRQRSGEWAGWAETVVAQISACQRTMNGLHRALLDGWREITERLAARTSSTTATAIGQQIHLKQGKKKRRF